RARPFVAPGRGVYDRRPGASHGNARRRGADRPPHPPTPSPTRGEGEPDLTVPSGSPSPLCGGGGGGGGEKAGGWGGGMGVRGRGDGSLARSFGTFCVSAWTCRRCRKSSPTRR